ncbi:sugar phosphate nucleotidyltransferase [Flavonifractor plautii]|nr:sugar phosphate nucleotidyltransferase [Flavonifractor plautii]
MRGRGGGVRPLTLERPLPLLSLFDKPLLAHQAGLLRRHGVREIGVALPRLSRMVEDAMGDGEELGVRFTWLPCRGRGAGAAGGLRRVSGEEDALVLPGGGLGDLDLSALLAFHQVHRSAATLALAHRPPAAGRALVFSDGEGRVERLLDAPAGRLLASQVETGVCILTAAARAGAAGEGRWPGASPPCWTGGGPVRGSPGGAVAGAHRRRSLSGRAGRRFVGRAAAAVGCPPHRPRCVERQPLPPSVQVVPPAISVPASRWGRAPCWGPTVLEGAPRWAAGLWSSAPPCWARRRRSAPPCTARCSALARRPGRGGAQ